MNETPSQRVEALITFYERASSTARDYEGNLTGYYTGVEIWRVMRAELRSIAAASLSPATADKDTP